MYILTKEGVYDHGTFWIGDDLEEGKRQADEHASRDSDDYHAWKLCTFIVGSDPRRDPHHIVVYKGIRSEKEVD